jgi:hypothetical protein
MFEDPTEFQKNTAVIAGPIHNMYEILRLVGLGLEFQEGLEWSIAWYLTGHMPFYRDRNCVDSNAVLR